MQQHANTCRFTPKDVLIVAIETVVLILVAQIVIHFATPLPFISDYFKNGGHESIETTLLYIFQSVLFLFPLYTYIYKKYGSTFSDFGFRRVPVIKTIKLVLKAFGIVFLFGFLITALQLSYNIQIPGFGQQDSHIPLFGTAPLDIVLAVVVVGVLAPVVEELIFRGFLLQTLLKYVPTWAAALIVAVIFGLIHFEFQSAGILIFLGLILNWLYIKSNSTIPGIAFHVINNLLAFWLEFLR